MNIPYNCDIIYNSSLHRLMSNFEVPEMFVFSVCKPYTLFQKIKIIEEIMKSDVHAITKSYKIFAYLSDIIENKYLRNQFQNAKFIIETYLFVDLNLRKLRQKEPAFSEYSMWYSATFDEQDVPESWKTEKYKELTIYIDVNTVNIEFISKHYDNFRVIRFDEFAKIYVNFVIEMLKTDPDWEAIKNF
jgi:hypothetical protein